jgi:D-amino-acid oxidase
VADVVVIGAGVIGLTSAICLAEDGLDVRIVAADPPQQTTSRVAGAMWGSSLAGPADDVRRWAEVSLTELRGLADVPESGARIARGRLVARTSEEGPPPFLFPSVEITRRPQAPAGYRAAFALDVPIVDMPRHLAYLVARVEAAGGAIEVRSLRTLGDVAGEAPVVVNCSGVGARSLVPDPKVQAVRGQHVVVENPGLDEFLMEEPAPEWACWFPHGDHVVLGGNAQEGDWSLDPDPVVASRSSRAAPRSCRGWRTPACSSIASGCAQPAPRCASRPSSSGAHSASTTTATAVPASRWRGAVRATSARSSTAESPAYAARRCGCC